MVIVALSAAVALLALTCGLLVLMLRDARQDLRLAERTIGTVERFVACLERVDAIESVTGIDTHGGQT